MRSGSTTPDLSPREREGTVIESEKALIEKALAEKALTEKPKRPGAPCSATVAVNGIEDCCDDCPGASLIGDFERQIVVALHSLRILFLVAQNVAQMFTL